MRSIAIALVAYCLLSAEPAQAQRFTGDNAVPSTSVWETAKGVLPSRMVHSDVGPGAPLYRTIWRRSDANVLVCLRDHEIELFGTPYDVAIVNTNLQVVRWGEITASQDDTPYCIAEVMTADERLPEELRNKWLLAVGFWENHFQQRHQLLHTAGVTNSPAEVEAELARLPSECYFELIRWHDSEVTPRYGSGNLYRVPNLKIRWIEASSNLLSRAEQNLSHSYRFEMRKTVIEAEMRSSSGHKQNPQSQERNLFCWPFREMGPDVERFYQERAIAALRTEIIKTEARVKSLRKNLSGKTGTEQMAKELDMEERILAALIMRLRVEEIRNKKIEPSH